MIETRYREWRIHYDEDRDVWTCSEEGVEPKTLKLAKTQLANKSKTERKINIKALQLDNSAYAASPFSVVTITVLCPPDPSRFSSRKGEITDCWITDGKGRRSKEYLRNLVPLDSREAVQAWADLWRAAKAADKKADAALDKLPRLDGDELLKVSKPEKERKQDHDA